MAHADRSSLRGLWGDGRGWLLLGISVAWFFLMGTQMIYPVILPQITQHFQLGYGGAGLVLALLWFAFAAMNIPGGMLADRVGERAVLTISVALASGGIALVATAPNVWVFVFATVCFGAGNGMYGTTGTTILTDLYPEHGTTAIGVSHVAGSLGMIALPAVVGSIVVGLGWRFGIGLALPGLAVGTCALWLTIPRRTSAGIDGDADASRTVDRMVRAFFDRTMVLLVVVMTCVGIVFQGVTGFLPLYLMDVKGFAQWEAAVLFGVLFTASMVAQVTSGPVAERIGRRNALIGYAAVSAPALVILPFVDHVLMIGILVWLTGLIMGVSPVGMGYVIAFIPDDIQGSVFGVTRTMFIGFGVLAPPAIGLLANDGLFDVGIGMLGGMGVLAIVFSVWLPRVAAVGDEDMT